MPCRPHCKQIRVSGLIVTCPEWLPSTGWSLNHKGYVIYTSRRKQDLILRGARMHRVVMQALAGERFTDEIHVHHQDLNKLNNCPLNLIKCHRVFNPSAQLRCPWTGRYMTAEEFLRRVA